MDELVEWMFQVGPGYGKRTFEQALVEGIDSLNDPPEPLRKFFTQIETLPPWFDRDLVARGVEPAQRAGRVLFYVLRDLALMGGYTYFNSMNQTLARAGSLTSRTSLRLGETGKWLHDVTERGGLERFGPGFITTLRVRLVHALVRRALARRALARNEDWEHDTWGMPINQVDMLATYLAFGPVALMGQRIFGVHVTRSEAKAAMHMWRYIGWLSGVDEELLACTERDGIRKLYHAALTHCLPDEKVRELGQALRDEPLRRNLPEPQQSSPWAWLRRRFLYHQHLSNSAIFLGPWRRRKLGLPLFVLPWNPLLTAPIRFAYLATLRMLGKGRLEAYAKRQRAKQALLLTSYFGGEEVDIIRPKAEHPAHVA